ncbi:HNH endonuclease signature motif containing protein, partial [Propioniciclava sp. MC1595]|uniref:HNH endonuclease n=2 Tax=Propioniciclava sp. MC1595 TaxID=2760308 RepID=UPI0028154578
PGTPAHRSHLRETVTPTRQNHTNTVILKPSQRPKPARRKIEAKPRREDSAMASATPSSSKSCLSIVGYALLALGALGQIMNDPTSGTVVLVIILMIAAVPVVRYIRMKRYFASEEFQSAKAELSAVVKEHNEITDYASEIRNRKLFELGVSSTGGESHLATYENTSRHNYKRDRNVANFQAPNVHNCSLQVVRNASGDPLTYLMRYFDIKANEQSLERVESLGESISSLEGAIQNLHDREASITNSINPPKFIMKHYRTRFMEQMGVELSPIEIPYPEYVFEYVSAGGNSSQRTTVKLTSDTIDALIEKMSERIRFRKSAAGQRALMTTRLRSFIKDRDNHTCQTCTISVAAEPHLLLEVDHITPVSRGGMSTPENLQTLCWRCNRTKSNKVPA